MTTIRRNDKEVELSQATDDDLRRHREQCVGEYDSSKAFVDTITDPVGHTVFEPMLLMTEVQIAAIDAELAHRGGADAADLHRHLKEALIGRWHGCVIIFIAFAPVDVEFRLDGTGTFEFVYPGAEQSGSGPDSLSGDRLTWLNTKGAAIDTFRVEPAGDFLTLFDEADRMSMVLKRVI